MGQSRGTKLRQNQDVYKSICFILWKLSSYLKQPIKKISREEENLFMTFIVVEKAYGRAHIRDLSW